MCGFFSSFSYFLFFIFWFFLFTSLTYTQTHNTKTILLFYDCTSNQYAKNMIGLRLMIVMVLISYWLRFVKCFINAPACVYVCVLKRNLQKNNHTIYNTYTHRHSTWEHTNDAADPMISSNPKFRLFLWFHS